MDESLRQRLAAIGVEIISAEDPFALWCQLRAAHGARATLIDLYSLVAEPRGVAAEELPLEERVKLTERALPIMWPGYQVPLGSERAVRDPIEVVPYDPEWPRQFDSWRTRLANALGAATERIEHVGSTAVPGLPAKPVIDIQVSVSDLANESDYVPQIEGLGVQLRSRDVEHRFFRPFSGLPREMQVHVCTVRSEWERQHLLFRDYLRGRAPARDAYLKAKRAAATRWLDDRIAYADAKTEVIVDLLAEAEKWASSVGWRT